MRANWYITPYIDTIVWSDHRLINRYCWSGTVTNRAETKEEKIIHFMMTSTRKARKSAAAATAATATSNSATSTDSTPKKRGRPQKSISTPATDENKIQLEAPPTVENSATKKRKRKMASPASSNVPQRKSSSGNPDNKNRKRKNKKSNRSEKKAVDVVVKDDSSRRVKNTNSKKVFPTTLDARVHRLRHMRYIPGSISAFTPKSTKDGQIVVARTDGSYELKSVTLPPATSNSSSMKFITDNISNPTHRLITIAETAPHTGTKAVADNGEDEDNSMIVDSSDDDVGPEFCPDSASSLCWIYASSTPFCVGSGPNGNLWIIDFKTSRPADIVSSGGGGVFDMATCSSDDEAEEEESLPLVAAACEDGSVRVWRILVDMDGRPQIQDPPIVTLPSAGAPVLSLVWKRVATQKQGKSLTFQTVVFAAIADGTIRKYGLDLQQNCSSINSDDPKEYFYSVLNPPKPILRMTVENKGRKDPTKVWTLLLLRDSTLVAGNSLGQVQFWNGETGTLTQTVIQSNSLADVLKMVTNSDETKIFCSGVDSRVVCLERKQPPITAAAAQKSNANALSNPNDLTALVTSHLTTYRPWKMSVSQRPHTHDVKAMAIVRSLSKETLLTGGVDTKICSYSVSTFAQSQPQTWYPWPSATSLFSSSSSEPGLPKLVAVQRHDRVELYELENLKTYRGKWNQGSQFMSEHESRKVTLAQHPSSFPVGTIRLTGDDESLSSSPLRASMLSSDGKFLAVSNMTSTYVFRLSFGPDASDGVDSVRLQPTKVELPVQIQNTSATTFLFVGDTLYVGDSSASQQVHVVNLNVTRIHDSDESKMDTEADNNNEGKSEMKQTILLPVSKTHNTGQVALPIQSIHADGEFMVTVSHSCDNAIHIFKRTSKKRPYNHYWTLPSLGSGNHARPAAVALLDGNRLVVATYRSQLYVFDMDTKSLNEWSEKYGFPIKDKKWTEDSLCGRGYPLRLIPHENGRLIMVRTE